MSSREYGRVYSMSPRGYQLARFPGMRTWHVYFPTNRSGTLYVGVTNDLPRRVWEHRAGLVAGFTHRYRIDRLVAVETFTNPTAAIAREKQVKGWARARKVKLISAQNPAWRDLAAEWTDDGAVSGGAPARWAHRSRRGLGSHEAGE